VLAIPNTANDALSHFPEGMNLVVDQRTSVWNLRECYVRETKGNLRTVPGRGRSKSTHCIFSVARPNALRIVEPACSVRVEDFRFLVLSVRSAVSSRAGFRGDCLLLFATRPKRANHEIPFLLV
jgi:hypothetical protein